MPDATRPRLLLLLPTTTYRTEQFVEAAHRLDVALTVASEERSAFAATEPARLLTLDFSNPKDAARQALEFSQSHPIAAVFGIDDQTAVVAAQIARVLGLRHNSVEAVEAAGNKYLQRLLLERAGVPVPRFALHSVRDNAQRLSARVEYPCVIKPLVLSASRGVIRVDDPAEFTDAFARIARVLSEPDVPVGEAASQILVEQYVSGPEFALEGLLHDGELETLALFDKPDPMTGPFFEETIFTTPSRFPRETQQALQVCAQQATQALGLESGPVHVELRYNDLGAWLIELAARPIGGKCAQVLRFGGDGGTSLEQLHLGRAIGGYEVIPKRERAAVSVMMIPVPRAGVLEDIRGVAAAEAVPLVTGVVISAHRGQQVRPLPEEARYLGFIFARGDSVDDVEAAVRDAYRQIEWLIV